MTKGAAIAMLLVAAFFWGAGNVANKTVLEHLDPATTVALRCLIAAFIVAPLALRETGNGSRRAFLRSAGLVSVLFAGALVVQQMAFISATVTNASFLVNTATIMTPLIAWLILGETQGYPIIVAAMVTVLGAFLMAGGPQGLSALNNGDLLCLLSALLYAGWVVALGRHLSVHGRPYQTSLVQFAATACGLGLAVVVSDPPSSNSLFAASGEILVLGVFSTGIAFVLMTRAQVLVSPSVAAVMVSAESVFGATGGWLLLGERSTLSGAIGAGLILAGILLGVADCRTRRTGSFSWRRRQAPSPLPGFVSRRGAAPLPRPVSPPAKAQVPPFTIAS